MYGHASSRESSEDGNLEIEILVSILIMWYGERQKKFFHNS